MPAAVPDASSVLAPIVAVETLRPRVQSNLCFVRLHARDGAMGLGEAFYGAAAVEAHVHDEIAPLLLGLDEPTPERVARLLRPYVGYQGGGVETRANGAIDIALWDLLGHVAGLGIADLLGGRLHDRVRAYNTCAGTRYVSATTRQASDNWGLPEGDGQQAYEDLEGFLTRPGRLARELLDTGIGAMKIWPFDLAAEASGGTGIDRDALARGVGIVEAIRSEVGDEMDILVELHALWGLRAAIEICDALAPLRPSWVEDPIRPDAVHALARLHAEVDVPIALGETCTGRPAFLALLQHDAIDVATVDIGWSGGLTEARKIASLMDTYGVPIAPHDCTGPVSLGAALHLVHSQPNGLIQETARAFMHTWYAELAEGVPAVREGHIGLPAGSGHGVRLRDGLAEDPGVDSRVSRL